MLVQDVMTKDPYVAFTRDSLRTVMNKLADADIRHLRAVEAGALVGIVSDRDLMIEHRIGAVPSYVDALRAARESLAEE